ncbi:MAG: hypothetical protein AAF380_03415 [Bacteroidota bacterium]
MIDKKGMIKMIIGTINMIAEPMKGFLTYQHNKMYEYYINFLEFVSVDLFDDCSIEDLMKKELPEWGIQAKTLQLLSAFLQDMEAFSDKHDKSDDFTLLRDDYWDTFVIKAQQCVKLLERDLKQLK